MSNSKFSREQLLNLAKGSFGILISKEGEYSSEMVNKSQEALTMYYKTEDEKSILSEAYHIMLIIAKKNESGKFSYEKLILLGNQLGIK